MFASIIFSGCFNSEYSNIRSIPKEATKRIVTRYYEPLLHNGEWICGREYENYSPGSDTVYYDAYGNVLLRIYLKGLAIEKHIYQDTSKGKIMESHYKWFKKYGKVQYIRNPNGKRLEVKHSGDVPLLRAPDPVKYIYNDNGQLIEKQYKDYKVRYNYMPPTVDENIITIQTSNEMSTKIYNNTSSKLQREIREEYRYGKLDSKYDIIFTYDSKGRVIKEETTGKTVGIVTIPMSEAEGVDEIEAYIIKNYYSPPKYFDVGKIIEWRFNDNGNNVLYLVRDLDPSSGRFRVVYYKSRRYVYEYNDKGEWIKAITFWLDNIPQTDINAEKSGKPEIITIREIKYL